MIPIVSIIGCQPAQEQPHGFVALSSNEADAKAEAIVSQMTLDEKLAYIGGDKNFFIRANERLGLPEVYMADATAGVHLRDSFRDIDLSAYQIEKSTAYPTPILLAATWNPELAYDYAKGIGEECRAGNVGILLGPGMNIYRHSQCGRNFEYFGEDPFLAARMISQYVNGVQSTGTVATLKHFVANNTDFFRRKSNSVVDERTLHEIYLPAFKAGIDAGAKAVMTAYNLVNGEWCGQSEYVINEVLRNQLGFEWLVMTDWWSVTDGVKLAKSGQDLEMPFTVALEDATTLLDEGEISEQDITRMAQTIVRTCVAMGLYDRQPEPSYYDTFPAHVETALQTAREGIVLLKNDHDLLPIAIEVSDILVTGTFVKQVLSGGGAATVTGYDNVTPWDALRREFSERISYVEDPTLEELRAAEVVLCNIATEDSEGWDRPFALPDDQEKLVKRCVTANPNTVVIVTSGSGIRMTDWHNQAGAIVYSWYLGQTGNVALAQILSGAITPSGKLPITIEREFSDSPGYGYTQGEQLYSDWNIEGEQAHPVYDVEYSEGVFVGYRWYEAQQIEPLYPFGFGLSYTTFDYADLDVSTESFSADDEVVVTVSVTNTGQVNGAEVVQLYISDVEASVDRPHKELKGFAKVELAPGETKQVTITLTGRDFSFWNPQTRSWFAEPGAFILHIGASSADIRLSQQVTLS